MLSNQCAQKVSFGETAWKEEKELGFAERIGNYEQIKDRVV